MPNQAVWKRCRRFGAAVLGFLAVLGTARSDQAAVDVEDLRPGLLAFYSDVAKGAGVEIRQLDPSLALCAPGE